MILWHSLPTDLPHCIMLMGNICNGDPIYIICTFRIISRPDSNRHQAFLITVQYDTTIHILLHSSLYQFWTFTEFSTNMRQHDTMMAFLLPKLNLNQLSLIEDTSSFLMRMHMHSYSILHTLENKTEHSTKITSHDTLVSFSSNF